MGTVSILTVGSLSEKKREIKEDRTRFYSIYLLYIHMYTDVELVIII